MPGFAILVDVSHRQVLYVPLVSGVEQRWSTVAGRFNNPSNNFYGGGIASVGRLQRSLGTDGTPAAGTVSLVLDSTDGAFDWLTARSTVESTLFKARFPRVRGGVRPGQRQRQSGAAGGDVRAARQPEAQREPRLPRARGRRAG